MTTKNPKTPEPMCPLLTMVQYKEALRVSDSLSDGVHSRFPTTHECVKEKCAWWTMQTLRNVNDELDKPGKPGAIAIGMCAIVKISSY